MSKNVGSADRIIRIIIGLVLIAYAVQLGFSSTGWNWVGWVGIVPIITALVGTCPAYSVLGVSTCAAHRRKP
jgi:multisubunit Na+/H+ antiporter MnhC subunit